MLDSIALLCYGIMAVIVYEGMRERVPGHKLRFWIAVFWQITMPIFLILIIFGVCKIKE